MLLGARRNFDFTLAASAQPNVQSSTERLQATAQSLSLSWGPQRLGLSFHSLSMVGYLVSAGQQNSSVSFCRHH